MKSIIKLTLLLTLILPVTASAHDFEVDGIYYNLCGTEATVTYRGTTYFEYLNEYSGDVVIPSTVTYGGTTYSVTGINGYAFYWCSSLTSIDIPNSVISIGESAFFICSNLASINIPNSVTFIGHTAFYSCSNLTSISVASNNPNYDSRNNCNAIIETATNTLIVGCQNTTIPNTITSIGYAAFTGCHLLTSINIPNSVTHIGEIAFFGCSSLTSINIPNSVTSIKKESFSNCANLTSILVASDNPKYDSRNNCNAIIETATNTLIVGCKNTTILNSVTSIGSYAFSQCPSLTSINIPNSVTSIGSYAFYWCSHLTSINIPNSVTSIGSFAFFICSSLVSIGISNSTTTIGERAFSGCNSLDNVYCYSSNPPECIIFDNQYSTFEKYSATLHVPAASLAAYFTAPVWCNFESIVGDAVAPTGIAISKDSVEMPVGLQFVLTATVTPANASFKEVIWYSTDTSVATVDNGTVTSVGYGECDIFAYCMGMPAICHISVTNRITLDRQEAMLLPNHMLTLTPSAPAMPNGFTVTSSEPTVAAARVMNGKVQIVGIKEGTTTITVGSADETAIPATCLVTVYTEPGDLNSDGFINIGDVTSIIDYLLSGDGSQISTKNADTNGDGYINIADVTALIDILLREE